MNQPQPLKRSDKPKVLKPKWRQRGWWMRQLHNWHFISAALSLAGILLFAITGFTLNHAGSISAKPVTMNREGKLPMSLLPTLKGAKDAPLPAPVAGAVEQATGIDPAGRAGEWSDSEVYVALPRPGGDAWVSIDRASGAITSERTDRGWIAYLNDLHKGRNAGGAWSWFIDIFAAACIIFTLTGLALLYFLSRGRRSTWPLVTVGVVIPVLLAMLFIH